MRAKRVEPLPVLPTDVQLTMTEQDAGMLRAILVQMCGGNRILFGRPWEPGNVAYDAAEALREALES